MGIDDGERLTNEVVELLQQLIRNQCVNDGTPESGQEVRSSDTLHAYLQGPGVEIQTFEATPGRRSLVVRFEGTDPQAPSMCWMGHTDVVPVSPDGWSRDPFGGELVDGEVWGRGAIDMLNMTASMAVATKELARRGIRPKGDLVYLAVADEEAGGHHGADWLVEHHWDEVGADNVITELGGFHIDGPEGHQVSICTAEKGAQWRRLRVKGRPGHGSVPRAGDNAAVKAAEVITRVANIRPRPYLGEGWELFVAALPIEPEVRAALLDPDLVWDACLGIPLLGPGLHARSHTTFSPNVVQGGVKTNVIPDVVEVDVDIRTVPGDSADDVDQYLRDALGELSGSVEIERLQQWDATATPTATPLWDALAEVTRRAHPDATVVPRMLTGGTDARFYRHKGASAYGFTVLSRGVDAQTFAGRFHGNDERIDVESLRLSTDAWIWLAEHFAG